MPSNRLSHMHVSLASGTSYVLTLAGSWLLSPLITASGNSDQMALFALALVSIWLILTNPKNRPIREIPPSGFYIALYGATTALMAGLFFSVDKLGYLSGLLFLFAALIKSYKNMASPFLVLTCLLVVLPAPAGLEAQVSLWLAEKEAELFVLLAQALGVDIFRFGPQVIAGDKAVTINAACSGTLLLWPTLLGFTVAAAARGASASNTIIFMLWAAPVAFALNLIRLLILLTVNFLAENSAAASLHDALGWLVMPLAWVLPILMIAPSAVHKLTFPALSKEKVVIVALFATTALLPQIYAAIKHADEPSIPVFSPPYYFSGWAGIDKEITEKEENILGAQTAIRREYTHIQTGKKILTTFMVHSNARRGQEHSSEACYKALGWIVEDQVSQTLARGTLLRFMKVRNHQQVQFVTEYIDKYSKTLNGHFLRVQIVTEATHTKAEQEAALFALLQTFDPTSLDLS